ncbi:MAG: adenylyl-sulfate kinase [Planctomycetota bacterium]|nr:MAG: adenylyl-sulfate kinase [Planctomycetota bacterium]
MSLYGHSKKGEKFVTEQTNELVKIEEDKEQMSIVIVGHVDHGKSTVIGRLLADTGSLPDGKLEAVRRNCELNSKPFEYAFLLDALKNEQAQGITIDTARCFFQSDLRHYIIIDAPGHIEFLKNMVTGAARAQAALLVIDAKEGIRENSKRHGYLISMLGIKDVVVLVNKLDLVDYSEKVFNDIKEEFTGFLKKLNVTPINFIPISAREGENIANHSSEMKWYKGPNVLKQLDLFEVVNDKGDQPFRLPVQDIYKFTQQNDDRRIVAGTVVSGKIDVGDEVTFYPSGKKSTISKIEMFNTPEKTTATVGEVCGYSLSTQIYTKAGEMMVKSSEEPPKVSNRFRVNIFWVGKAPMIKGKNYKLKLHATSSPVKLVDILNVLDASDLTSVANKQQVDRHDVAECVFETTKPVAFDLSSDIEGTSRVVIVDNFEIAGGGIIFHDIQEENTTLKQYIENREEAWVKGEISELDRSVVYGHKSKFILITGSDEQGCKSIAVALEKKLFDSKFKAYYLGMSNLLTTMGENRGSVLDQNEQIKWLGELARFFTGSGQIFISAISHLDDFDIENLKVLNSPSDILVVNVGENQLNKYKVDLDLEQISEVDDSVGKIVQLLHDEHILQVEYYL